MRRVRHALLGSALLVLLIQLASGCSGTGPAAGPRAQVAATQRYRVAVMPFANYCRRSEAGSLLLPRITAGLAAAGLDVVSGPDLRPVLRRHRIRSQGMIGGRDARLLAGELDLDFLLLGSWDVYEEGANLELGLSVRVLDPVSLKLTRAVSLGRTAVDDVGWLGRGRVDSLGTLADLLVHDVLAAILPLSRESRPAAVFPQAVVVPLDNLSATDNAGAVCGAVLVSRLMAQGFPVVEPGFVRELQLDRETAYRGGIDLDNLHALADSKHAQVVITGTVDVFATGGDPATGVSEVALGLREIDPDSGRVLLTREIRMKGDDHDGWFRQGRIHSLSALTAHACDEFIRVLENALITETERRNS